MFQKLEQEYSLSNKIIGIDAINLRGGGGQTHLIEFLAYANPRDEGINRIIVWGANNLLENLNDKPWLIKVDVGWVATSAITRFLWQILWLPKLALKNNCWCLFSPGGSVFTSSLPTVTMCRNLLPFDSQQKKRFGFSITRIKLEMLKKIQLSSFRRASKTIFLTQFAQQVVAKNISEITKNSIIIPHGVSKIFRKKPRPQKPVTQFDDSKMFDILYVSPIDYYKNQHTVIMATNRLRNEMKWPLKLTLVGGIRPSLKKRFLKLINEPSMGGDWINYVGTQPYENLSNFYQNANLGIFASSCENLPNTLIEMMAAGLPIASSNCQPMPQILEESGLFFDPESTEEIYQCLKALISNPDLRTQLAKRSYDMAAQYNWKFCAQATLSQLADV